MDNQFTVPDEINKLLGNITKCGFACQRFIADPVYFKCAIVNVPLRIDIVMEMMLGVSAVFELNTSDLNDPVALRVMGGILTLRNNEADFITVTVE